MAKLADKAILVRGLDEHEAVKLSNSIRNYINENFDEVNHLLTYLQEPVYVEMAVTVQRPHPNHVFDIRIHAPKFEVIVKREGPELYKVIDEVFDVATNDLIKHKDKQLELRKKADYYK